MSAKLGSPVTLKYLYNETILSRFSLCLNRSVDVVSVVSGTVNDVSSILPVFGVIIKIFFILMNQWNIFFINERRVIHFVL